MSIVEPRAGITCAACGKTYTLRPELAGRRVKCKCGAVMQVPLAAATATLGSAPKIPAPAAVSSAAPAAPARSTAADDDDLYDVAPGAAPPAAPKPRTAVDDNFLMARLGTLPPPGPTPAQVEAERLAREAELQNITADSDVRDVYVPVVLILLGIAMAFVEAMRFTKEPAQSVGEAIPMVGFRVALAAGLMLPGMFMATAMMEVCFVGSFRRSILRFLGIAIGPAWIYGTLTHGLGGDLAGPAAGVFASLFVYFALFKLLMKLDLQDASVCTLVTWIMVAFANYAGYKVDGLLSGAWT